MTVRYSYHKPSGETSGKRVPVRRKSTRRNLDFRLQPRARQFAQDVRQRRARFGPRPRVPSASPASGTEPLPSAVEERGPEFLVGRII